jgi:hypothetical protein
MTAERKRQRERHLRQSYWHHQSERNDLSLAPQHRQTLLQCHCLAGYKNAVCLLVSCTASILYPAQHGLFTMASVHFHHFSDHSVWDALHLHPSKGCRETCHELEAEHGKGALKSITGLPFSTYFSGVKVKWMYQNIPEVQEAMDDGDAMIGTIDSWIIYNLTGGRGSGVHVTDGAKPAHCACYGDV